MNHINIALLGAVSKYLFHTLVSYSLSASASRAQRSFYVSSVSHCNRYFPSLRIETPLLQLETLLLIFHW